MKLLTIEELTGPSFDAIANADARRLAAEVAVAREREGCALRALNGSVSLLEVHDTHGSTPADIGIYTLDVIAAVRKQIAADILARGSERAP